MVIKDVKFMNNEAYLLKDISLTLHDCAEQMKAIKYDDVYVNYRDFKNPNVENTRFPSIIFAFYNIVFNLNKIPSPEELIKEYYTINSDDFILQGESIIYYDKTFLKKHIDARILRTYPSLVRDYHFYLMLVQSNCFDKVVYSCKTDISGKDIIIKHNNIEYQISLFVETKRSGFFKNIKNKYRHLYENEIQLPLDLNKAEKCGDFYVYGLKEVEKIKNLIL